MYLPCPVLSCPALPFPSLPVNAPPPLPPIVPAAKPFVSIHQASTLGTSHLT
ncbi:hypothetical protein CGRA01v4_00377 [Colletotrichum graminicola]|nr:hypothetical protein CGRA01v4_00377 [Colletotrichum graminicola]